MQLPSSSKGISSMAAMANPSVSPPMIWPSTIIGVIRTPQASTATTRLTSHCAAPDTHRVAPPPPAAGAPPPLALPLPGPPVDLDRDRVGPERIGHVGRVIV